MPTHRREAQEPRPGSVHQKRLGCVSRKEKVSERGDHGGRQPDKRANDQEYERGVDGEPDECQHVGAPQTAEAAFKHRGHWWQKMIERASLRPVTESPDQNRPEVGRRRGEVRRDSPVVVLVQCKSRRQGEVGEKRGQCHDDERSRDVKAGQGADQVSRVRQPAADASAG